MKAKDHPAYLYHLTNAYKLEQRAKQLKEHYDKKREASK